MAYDDFTKFIRRCVAAMKDGTRCRAWAVWGDEGGRCRAHGGRSPTTGKPEKTRYTKCTCAAYPFPHRPGGGLCNWPYEPSHRWKPIPGMRPKPGEGEPWPATIEAISLLPIAVGLAEMAQAAMT